MNSRGLRRATFVLGRTLFGGTLAFMGAANLRDVDEMVEYAEANDVPMANVAVPLSSTILTIGGVMVALGWMPRVAATAVATFLATATPKMHDFWNLEGEERQQQQVHFMKNLALFGAAIAFLVRGKSKSAARGVESR